MARLLSLFLPRRSPLSPYPLSPLILLLLLYFLVLFQSYLNKSENTGFNFSAQYFFIIQNN
uniref:Uncharacterized protein n=1 Tax=Solanum lycopersicum TaxID=4081 RepID=A0A3Q7IHM0_SOLLC